MSDMIEMTPRRPYLFRAFYDWILDNDLTPYIVVDATLYGVIVPSEYISDGQIVLNLAPQSVGEYLANNDQIEFKARFGGSPQYIVVPMAALIAIYAKENGVGLGFEPEPQYEYDQAPDPSPEKPKNPFRVVK